MNSHVHKWETRPLECWSKFKEMRMNHYLEVASAREQGKILVTGSSGAPIPLLNGFGDDVVFLSGEPYAANVAANVPLSLEAMAATEARGYARDMCGYMRNYWGSMWMDRYMFTDGPFPKPHFCLTENACDAGHAKWYQVVAEHYGIPILAVDLPVGPPDTSIEQKIEYMVAQMHDCIEQMEKIVGRKVDDEQLIEGCRTYFECEAIWGEIGLLNGAVPAPLEAKTLMGLLPVTMVLRNKRESVILLKELRDEVKWRIANQIAAVENERIRVLNDMQGPWNYVRLYRNFVDRGVVFVGVFFYILNGGNLDFHEDGSVSRAKTADELGWPMKTRDDALRAWSRHCLTHPCLTSMTYGPQAHAKRLMSVARHLKADGLVLSYNRGCPMNSQFLPEVKLLLDQEDLPVAVYECNMSDARDTDVGQITKRLNAFVEMLESNAAARVA